MSDDVLVKVEHVSKKFCRTLKRSLWYGVQDVVGELLGRKGEYHELRPGEFWSVDDVSFELKRGECLGLIGPNGAGKSTLLKMLNGLIKPDKGRITMRGRVGALIELGAGFNPILTGRENIYVNGAILGFSKEEITRKFDEIVDFSGIEDFIDTPVQNYSSGMKVRLGFAVASQMKPDVLIIDEVLAVGDMGFRAKCYNAIASLAQQTAVIFVSHSMTHIGRLCTKSMVMQKGHCIFSGNVPESLLKYNNLFINEMRPANRSGNQKIHFESISITDKNVQGETLVRVGEKMKIDFKIKSFIDTENIIIDLCFIGTSDELVAQCNNFVYPHDISMTANETLDITLEIPCLALNPGVYKLSALLQTYNMSGVYDWIDKFETIKIVGSPATANQQIKGMWCRGDLQS